MILFSQIVKFSKKKLLLHRTNFFAKKNKNYIYIYIIIYNYIEISKINK